MMIPAAFRASFLATAVVLCPAVLAGQGAGTVVVTVGKTSVPSRQSIHLLLDVRNAATGAEVRTDSTDDLHREFKVPDLPAGSYRLEARAIGFAPETTIVDVAAGRTEHVSMELRHVAELDPVAIAGTGKGHLDGFERRRHSGKGTYITGEDIARDHQTQLSGVLKNVRGLRIECRTVCAAQMVRSTSCEPRYFLNGFPTDAQVLTTPVLDVAGIEIYRGPSETPGEFLSGDSMCGAIVIWTR